MPFKKVIVLGAALFCLSVTCSVAATVGAIRWDAWVGDELNSEYDSPDFRHGIWNEEAVYHEKWRCRLPFYASNISRTNVRIRCTTQSVMDQEIESAAGALDYWAFLDYPEEPMHEPLELYLSSSKKNQINFCIILNKREWWLHKQKYVDYFKEASYQKVLGGRPLVYIFHAASWMTYHVADLTAMSVGQGAGDPYFVTMGWDPATVQEVGDDLGADAVTAYAYATEGSSTGLPYSQLVSNVKARWNDFAAGGHKVVPFVMAGWDRRPRADHAADNPGDTASSWTNIVQNRWNEKPNPKELADFVRDASVWAETSSDASEADTVIIYNWNEYTEGGWLSPGYSIASTNDNIRLEFIRDIRDGAYSLGLSNLVGYWPFDFDGDIYDYSQYQNHAYRDGPMALVAGAKNKCLQCVSGGANCFVPHHSSLESMPAITVSGWVCLDSLPPPGDPAGVVGKNQVYGLSINSEGRVQFSVGTVNNEWNGSNTFAVAQETAVTTGKWVHVAGTYAEETGETKVYVNGVLGATATGASGALRSNAPVDVKIGNSSLDGRLDEVRIYRSALSRSEIDNLFVEYKTLLKDSFDTVDSPHINAGLAERQSGTERTVAWTSTTNVSKIAGNSLQLFKSGAAGTVTGILEKDFAAVVNDLKISVELRPDPLGGFAMVNFGMAAADGTSAQKGYSFRLDVRYAVKTLKFFDNGTQVASMDVTSLMTGEYESLGVEFRDGNTVSAVFNGTDYDFGAGQLLYTGTTEPENRLMLSWFHDGDPASTSALFDNLLVEGRLRGGYDAWIALHGLSDSAAGPDADPDGDRFSNFYEYSFGGDPANGMDTGLPPESALVAVDGTNVLEYVYYRRSAFDSGLNYLLEYKTNLVSGGDWADCADSTFVNTETCNSGMETVTNRIPIDADLKFIRIKVD